MKLRRNVKFDFIIYNCLLGASVFLIIGAKSYCASLDNYNGFSSEIKNALKEIKGEANVEVSETEPDQLANLDKKQLIETYLYSLLDEAKTSSTLSSEMIKSWQDFEIIDTKFLKTITDTYYSYSFDVKIPNSKALLPIEKNEDLSTNEYVVITLIANISTKNNLNQVKSIDLSS